MRLAILAAIIATALVLAYRTGILTDAKRARDMIVGLRQLPALPVWFAGAYAVTASLGIPPIVMTFVGGALFGTRFGTLYSWIGAVLGALGGYAIARWLGASAVRQLLGKRRSAKLDRLLDDVSFTSLFRLRVNPIVPFNLLNFASGVAKAPFIPYLLSAIVGVLPATAVYAYFADAVIGGATRARDRALWHVVIASIIVLALSYAPAIRRRVLRMKE